MCSHLGTLLASEYRVYFETGSFGSWFINPAPQKKEKTYKTRKKAFCETSEKVQKQGRDENTQEHYPTVE